MRVSLCLVVCLGIPSAVSCSDAAPSSPSDTHAIRYRVDVTPVTRVADAKPGVFIPPFRDCRPSLETSRAAEGGQVCTNVAISGATEPDKSFDRYASCDVVITQRPYWPAPPAKAGDAADPRLADAAFATEVAWAKSQVAASGCVCCHENRVAPRGASQWDIGAPGNWLDTVSDGGLALFAGFADSSVLGAYPASDNHGFDRTSIGLPSTDPERMKKLIVAELAHRGIDEAKARAVPPFGGPIYENAVRPPTACDGQGIDPEGRVVFRGGKARYVYLLEPGSKNPGVPPNLDRPEGTAWRLDVLPNAEAIESGFLYGTTPEGSFQDLPESSPAPALRRGKKYQFVALRDVGVPITNCLFVYGEPLGDTTPPPVPPPTGAAYGSPCTDTAACAAPTNYCAVMPGQTTGYCTTTGCIEDPTVCPSGWSCFDLSKFQPGGPAVCVKP
jgi:hypothetical protein